MNFAGPIAKRGRARGMGSALTSALRVFSVALTLPFLVLGTSARANEILFGVIAADSPGETKDAWEPVLADLSKTTGYKIKGFYAANYAGVQKAVMEDKIQVAWISGRSALDVIAAGKMDVVAQVARRDGSEGYRSVLLTRTDSPIKSAQDIFSSPGRYSYARGERQSVSGFLVPEQFFFRNKVSSVLHFKNTLTGNHQTNALSVANGEADVASNNNADLEKFRQKFPTEHSKLKVIWESDLIPHAPVMVRRDVPEGFKQKLRQALLNYGQGTSAEAKRQQANLQKVHDLAGFVAADNKVLLPVAEVTLLSEKLRVQESTFPTADAKERRLKQVDSEFAAIFARLKSF